MAALDKFETQLDVWLNKDAPVKLPPNGRKGLADAMWIIALVLGILQLVGTWGFWNLGHAVNRGVDFANSLSAAYGGGQVAVSHLGFFYYFSLLVLLADAALLLLATPGLKAMQKGGWNLLFYSVLLNAVYGLVRLFTDVGGGIGAFIGAIVGTVLGAYFLFQVRDYFLGKKVTVAGHTDPAAHKPAAKQ